MPDAALECWRGATTGVKAQMIQIKMLHCCTQLAKLVVATRKRDPISSKQQRVHSPRAYCDHDCITPPHRLWWRRISLVA